MRHVSLFFPLSQLNFYCTRLHLFFIVRSRDRRTFHFIMAWWVIYLFARFPVYITTNKDREKKVDCFTKLAGDGVLTTVTRPGHPSLIVNQSATGVRCVFVCLAPFFQWSCSLPGICSVFLLGARFNFGTMSLSSDYKPRVINLIVFPCSASISFGYEDGEVDFRELDATGSALGSNTVLLCHFSINGNT